MPERFSPAQPNYLRFVSTPTIDIEPEKITAERRRPAPSRGDFTSAFLLQNQTILIQQTLRAIQRAVGPVPCHQLCVAARFRDAAIFDDNDPVRAADRREAVCNDQCRTPLGQSIKRGLDFPLRDGVQR